MIKFKNSLKQVILWQLNLGVVGIEAANDFSSCANIFIPFLINFINYDGDRSSVAERATVARITGVRFSPTALNKRGKMKILFICKYNAFRSRVAEEYFNKINRNKKITTLSRGIIMGGDSDPDQKTISKKLLGINIGKEKTIAPKIAGAS